MKTIEISLDNARAAYNGAENEGIKKALATLVGKKILFDDITEVVKSYEDACELEGLAPLTLDAFEFLPEQDRECAFAEHQITVITRVLNEGWKRVAGETGYYPIFNRPKSAGGPGVSCYGCVHVSGTSTSFVGARQTFRTPALVIYAAKQFLHIYSIIHNQQ